MALSDTEAEEDTRDITLTNEDGSADDARAAGPVDPGSETTRAAGPVDPGSETSSPHGRSRGSGYSRETRAL